MKIFLMEVLLVLLTLTVACLASVSGHNVDPLAETSWKVKLGNTPMPKAIIDSLEGLNKDGVKIDVHNLEGKNVDTYDLSRSQLLVWRNVSSDPASAIHNAELLQSGLDMFLLKNHLTHPGRKVKFCFDSDYKSKFLPLYVAKSIPFSHDKMSEILNLLSVRPNSIQADIVEDVVNKCEQSPEDEEDCKYCATSLEGLVDNAMSCIGSSQVRAFSTTIDTKITMEYTIEKAQKVSSDRTLLCHKMKYPYAVFYCHSVRHTDAYVVSLVAANGKKGKAAAVCHQDTSSWDPEHFAFKLLQVKPGTVPICHFLFAHEVIWTPSSNVMSLATQAQQL